MSQEDIEEIRKKYDNEAQLPKGSPYRKLDVQ